MNDKAIVLTGGPGMGKTTIINYLNGLGHDVMPEAGKGNYSASGQNQGEPASLG